MAVPGLRSPACSLSPTPVTHRPESQGLALGLPGTLPENQLSPADFFTCSPFSPLALKLRTGLGFPTQTLTERAPDPPPVGSVAAGTSSYRPFRKSISWTRASTLVSRSAFIRKAVSTSCNQSTDNCNLGLGEHGTATPSPSWATRQAGGRWQVWDPPLLT